jgi:hypothetical protein
MGEAESHAARKPGPLLIIQYALVCNEIKGRPEGNNLWVLFSGSKHLL